MSSRSQREVAHAASHLENKVSEPAKGPEAEEALVMWNIRNLKTPKGRKSTRMKKKSQKKSVQGSPTQAQNNAAEQIPSNKR